MKNLEILRSAQDDKEALSSLSRPELVEGLSMTMWYFGTNTS
jgi:hypothetical protein